MSLSKPRHEGNETSNPPIEGEFDALELGIVHSDWLRVQAAQLDAHQKFEGALIVQHAIVAEVTDWERRVGEQLHETRENVETLASALDRIKLVALNLGLEGARLGDLAGKMLVNVSDELRQLSARSLELLLEQASSVDRLETDRRKLESIVERCLEQVLALTSLRTDSERLTAMNRHGIERLEHELERGTGLDAESRARLLTVTEQARALVSSFSNLETPERSRRMRDALLAELSPILRYLAAETAMPE